MDAKEEQRLHLWSPGELGTEEAILSSVNLICFVLGGCQGGAKVTSMEPWYIGYGGSHFIQY